MDGGTNLLLSETNSFRSLSSGICGRAKHAVNVAALGHLFGCVRSSEGTDRCALGAVTVCLNFSG